MVTDLEKYSNYVFRLPSEYRGVPMTKHDMFIIKNAYLTGLLKDRENVLLNTIIDKKLVVESEKEFKYFRSEHYILTGGIINKERDYLIERDHFLLFLIDLYVMSESTHNEVKMKWIINTLIDNQILVNKFDPAHNKINESVKEFFS
jgi:hypothetical protein